jgi:hypothetical protein
MPAGNITPAAGSKPPPGGTAVPAASKPPAAYRWRCVEACTFQGRYREEGDIVELQEKRDRLPHFVPAI